MSSSSPSRPLSFFQWGVLEDSSLPVGHTVAAYVFLLTFSSLVFLSMRCIRRQFPHYTSSTMLYINVLFLYNRRCVIVAVYIVIQLSLSLSLPLSLSLFVPSMTYDLTESPPSKDLYDRSLWTKLCKPWNSGGHCLCLSGLNFRSSTFYPQSAFVCFSLSYELTANMHV